MKSLFRGKSKGKGDASSWTSKDEKFLKAIENNDINKIEELLTFKGTSSTKVDVQGHTPLHRVVARGNLDVLDILLRRNVDTNCKDAQGRVPLHDACRYGRVEAAERLLKKNNNAATAIDNYDLSPLHHACIGNNLPCVKLLCRYGAPADPIDKEGRTPLFYASKLGHVDICQELVNNGANINAKDKERKTPLMLSAQNNKVTVCDYLVNKGATVLLTDDHKHDAKHYAERNSNHELLEILERATPSAAWPNEQSPEDERGPRTSFLQEVDVGIDHHRMVTSSEDHQLSKEQQLEVSVVPMDQVHDLQESSDEDEVVTIHHTDVHIHQDKRKQKQRKSDEQTDEHPFKTAQQEVETEHQISFDEPEKQQVTMVTQVQQEPSVELEQPGLSFSYKDDLEVEGQASSPSYPDVKGYKEIIDIQREFMTSQELTELQEDHQKLQNENQQLMMKVKEMEDRSQKSESPASPRNVVNGYLMQESPDISVVESLELQLHQTKTRLEQEERRSFELQEEVEDLQRKDSSARDSYDVDFNKGTHWEEFSGDAEIITLREKVISLSKENHDLKEDQQRTHDWNNKLQQEKQKSFELQEEVEELNRKLSEKPRKGDWTDSDDESEDSKRVNENAMLKSQVLSLSQENRDLKEGQKEQSFRLSKTPSEIEIQELAQYQEIQQAHEDEVMKLRHQISDLEQHNEGLMKYIEAEREKDQTHIIAIEKLQFQNDDRKNDFDKKITELEEERNNLRIRLAESMTDNAQYKDTQASLDDQMKILLQRSADLEEENNKLHSQLPPNEIVVVERQASLAQQGAPPGETVVVEKHVTLEQGVRPPRKKKSVHEDQVKKLEEENFYLTMKLDDLVLGKEEKLFPEVKRRHEEQLEAVTQEAEALLEDNKNLATELSESRARNREYDEELRKNRFKIDELEQDKVTLFASLNAAGPKDSVDVDEIGKLNRQIAELEDEKKSLAQKLNASQERIRDDEEEMEAVKSSLDKICEENKSLKEKLFEVDAVIMTERGKNDDMEKSYSRKLEQLKHEHNELSEYNQDLIEQGERLSKDHALNISRHKEAIAQMEEDNRKLKDDNKRLQQEKKDIEKFLEEDSDKNDSGKSHTSKWEINLARPTDQVKNKEKDIEVVQVESVQLQSKLMGCDDEDLGEYGPRHDAKLARINSDLNKQIQLNKDLTDLVKEMRVEEDREPKGDQVVRWEALSSGLDQMRQLTTHVPAKVRDLDQDSTMEIQGLGALSAHNDMKLLAQQEDIDKLRLSNAELEKLKEEIKELEKENKTQKVELLSVVAQEIVDNALVDAINDVMPKDQKTPEVTSDDSNVEAELETKLTEVDREARERLALAENRSVVIDQLRLHLEQSETKNDHLIKKMNDMEKTREEAEKEIDSLEKKIDQLRKENEQAEKKISDLEKASVSLSGDTDEELRALQKHLEDLERKNEASIEMYSVSEQESKERLALADNRKMVIEQLQKDKMRQETDNDSLKKQLSESERDSLEQARLVQDYREEIAQLNNRLIDAEDSNDSMSNQVQKYKDDLDQLQQRMMHAEDSNELLNKQLSEKNFMDVDFEELQEIHEKEIKDLLGRIEDLEDDNNVITKKLKLERGRYEDLEESQFKETDEYMERIAALELQVKDFEKAEKRQNQEIVQPQIVQQVKAAGRLQIPYPIEDDDKVARLKDENNRLNLKLKDVTDEKNKAEALKIDLEEKFIELSEDRASLQKELSQMQTMLDNTNTKSQDERNAELEHQRQQLEQELRELQKSTEGLRNQPASPVDTNLFKKCATLEGENQKLKVHVVQLEVDNGQMKVDNKQLREDVDQLQKNTIKQDEALMELKDENEELRDQFEKLKVDYCELDEKSENNKEILTIMPKLQEENNDLQSENRDLKEDVRDLQLALENVSTEMDKVKDAQELQDENENLRKRVSQHEQILLGKGTDEDIVHDNQRLHDEVDRLKDLLKAQAEELSKEQEYWHDRNKQLNKEKDELEDTTRQQQKDLDNLATALSDENKIDNVPHSSDYFKEIQDKLKHLRHRNQIEKDHLMHENVGLFSEVEQLKQYIEKGNNAGVKSPRGRRPSDGDPETQIENLKRSNQSLSKEIVELHLMLEQHVEDKELDKKRIGELTEARDAMTSSIGIPGQKLQEFKVLENRCRELAKDLERSSEKCERLERENARLKNGIDGEKLKEIVQDSSNTLSPEFTQALVDQDNELTAMAAENRSLTRKCAELEDAIKKIKLEGRPSGALELQMADLQRQNERLKRINQENAKRHKEVVTTYRTHLLASVQGTLDPEVYHALVKIMQQKGSQSNPSMSINGDDELQTLF